MELGQMDLFLVLNTKHFGDLSLIYMLYILSFQSEVMIGISAFLPLEHIKLT